MVKVRSMLKGGRITRPPPTINDSQGDENETDFPNTDNLRGAGSGEHILFAALGNLIGCATVPGGTGH